MSRAVITRAHRLRLAVNASETARLDDFAWARAKAWNWALAMLGNIWGLDRSADRLRMLDQTGQPYRHVDKFTLIMLFAQEKASLDWTAGVPSRIFEYAFEDLIAAVSAFLKNRVPGGHSASTLSLRRKVGFPEFIPSREADTFTVKGAISLSKDKTHHKGPQGRGHRRRSARSGPDRLARHPRPAGVHQRARRIHRGHHQMTLRACRNSPRMGS